jgi:hypothetical protein
VKGTGNEPITVTACSDIGKSLVELVSYKGKWPKYFNISGERTTWNKIVELAEKATGKKFTVEYKSEDELRKVVKSAEDETVKFGAQVDLMYLEGDIDIPVSKESEEILKNVKFTEVKEILQFYQK